MSDITKMTIDQKRIQESTKDFDNFIEQIFDGNAYTI